MKFTFRMVFALVLLVTAAMAFGSANGEKPSDNSDPNYPITLTVFTQAARQQPNPDNKLFKYIEDKLNVTFDWDILVGEIAQKRGVMIAGEDYPDLIEINETQFIEAGALIPLEDLVEKYAPNIKEHFGTTWDLMRSDDGHIYYLTNYGVYTGKNQSPDWWGSAMFLQKEVLKEYGYPEIKTLDDYFGIIKDYADKYPTINGQPTIPFTILTYDWHAFAMWNPPIFLAGNANEGNGIVDPETHEYNNFFTMDISKQWFKALNKLNDEGYVDRSAFTDNYDQYLAKISSGRVLAMHDQRWQFGNAWDALKDQDMYNRTYAGLPVVFDESIKPHYRDWPEPNLGRGVGISIKAKDPVRIIRFIGALLQEDVQRTIEWGIEGEDWQFNENGQPYRTQEQHDNWENSVWQEQNRALLIRDVFPKWEGSWSDGYPTDLGYYFPERSKYLRAEDVELFTAYDVNGEAELLDKDPPPNDIWYPTWSMPNPPDGSDAQIALQRCDQTMRKYMPMMILADPADFDSIWTEYVAQMNKDGIATYEAYMQEELDKRIAKKKALLGL